MLGPTWIPRGIATLFIALGALGAAILIVSLWMFNSP